MLHIGSGERLGAGTLLGIDSFLFFASSEGNHTACRIEGGGPQQTFSLFYKFWREMLGIYLCNSYHKLYVNGISTLLIFEFRKKKYNTIFVLPYTMKYLV